MSSSTNKKKYFYKFKSRLGSGNFGEVVLVERTSDGQVKIIFKTINYYYYYI